MLPDQNSINADLKHKLDLLQKQLNAQKADNLALQSKYDEDMKKMGECLFRIERFIGSDSDFRFYTGFPDYSTFKEFFDYLSPACNHLVYHGSNTAPITPECQVKRGKERSLSPEQELFLVLSRFRCGLLLRLVPTDLVCLKVLFPASGKLGLHVCTSGFVLYLFGQVVILLTTQCLPVLNPLFRKQGSLLTVLNF